MYQVMSSDEEKRERSLQEVKESTPRYPLLGYTVIATLDSNVEISHADLATIATPLGFGDVEPPQVEPPKVISRAMAAFLKEVKKGESDALSIDSEGKALLRRIKTPDKDRIILALVQEKTVLEELGLSYFTNLRVFYVKGKPATKTTAEVLPILIVTLGDPRIIGSIDPETYVMTGEERDIRDEIQAKVDYYLQVYKSEELSRWINAILEDQNHLAGKLMRSAGGVFFVLYEKRPQLIALKQLVEKDLPTTTGITTSRLTHIPIINEDSSVAQVQQTTVDAFDQKMAALEKNMQAIKEAPRTGGIKGKWMEERIKQYQAMQDELKLYDMLLGVRRKEIEKRLQTLEADARQLISDYAAEKAAKKAEKAKAEEGGQASGEA